MEERLLAKRFINQNDCWEFTGSKDSGGYGHIRYMKKLRKVHRVSAHIYKGFDIDSPLKVLHRCDNGKCFNPEHLFFGTQQDNITDMDKKGHRGILPGKMNPNAKLTDKQITEIFELRQQGWSQEMLWVHFDIHRSHLQRILRGDSWKHLNLPTLPRMRVNKKHNQLSSQ